MHEYTHRRDSRSPVCLLLFFACFFFSAALAIPQPYELSRSYMRGEKYKVTTRADLRQYRNGRFEGLSFRETRGTYTVTSLDPAPFVSGTVYVFEETKRDSRNVAKRIEKSVPVSFTVGENSLLPDPSNSAESHRYPHVRNFPAWPAEPVKPGDVWDAYGMRVVDPLRSGVYTRVRFYCRYTLLRTVEKADTRLAEVSAQYALRYRHGDDQDGDPSLTEISGTRKAVITFDIDVGRPVFINERVEEQFRYDGGTTIGFKGFVLTWFSDIVRLDRTEVVKQVADDLKEQGVEEVEVAAAEEGVQLRVNNIHFVPDQAIVLPDEKPRLQKLAEALKKIDNRTFKVIGHTADVGTAESQCTLSVERAKVIIDYLVASGLDAGRFIYEGRGGTDPIAPNDTEENRAKNRRVEIILLED